MKEVMKKNILNKKDKSLFSFSFKRVLIGFAILLVILLVITFVNGSFVHKSI